MEARSLFLDRIRAVQRCCVAMCEARPDVSGSSSGRAANSGIKPVSGVSAELRQLPATREFECTLLSNSNFSALSPRHIPPAGGKPASLQADIIDGLGTIAALIALACVAAFLLMLQ